MPTLLTAAPALEPISLAEVKAHLRIDTPDEDGLLQSLILTSRLHIEVALGLALINQSWSCFFDQVPKQFDLPIRPVRSVESIKLYASDGSFASLVLADFDIDLASHPARIVPRGRVASLKPGRAVNGLEVALVAGFGPSATDVPAPIRHALLQLVTHWYEHRDPGEVGTANARIPASVSALLAPWAPVRL